MRARWRRVTETSSEASCSSAVRAREASRKAASIINLGVLMPRRLAAAAMLRLVAAGIRRDVGCCAWWRLESEGTSEKLWSNSCATNVAHSLVSQVSSDASPPRTRRAMPLVQVRMGVRMTQTIANDADIHISLPFSVIRCQPLPRFETGVRIHVGTPDFQEPYQ